MVRYAIDGDGVETNLHADNGNPLAGTRLSRLSWLTNVLLQLPTICRRNRDDQRRRTGTL